MQKCELNNYILSQKFKYESMSIIEHTRGAVRLDMSVSIELAYITHVLSRNEVERCNQLQNSGPVKLTFVVMLRPTT
jgi:hypothetical protein